MKPHIALVMCSIFIIYLFWVDFKNNRASSSLNLWIPWVWFGIAASRQISFWFGGGAVMESPADRMEGSPLDRAVYFSMILIGFVILLKQKKMGDIVKKNIMIIVFIFYLLLSTIWSDYSFVAFKRWIKEIGNIIMIMIILSEKNPYNSFKTMVMRIAYICIPLSIIFNKYFPDISRMYSISGGDPQYQGIALHKNGLGILCLISGLVLWESLLATLREKGNKRNYHYLFLHFSLLFMIAWLLYMADSATATLCTIIGIIMIYILLSRPVKQNTKKLKYYIIIILLIGAIFYFSADSINSITGALDRDQTLSGRTELWGDIFAMKTNPLIGTGYQSFWLGERYEWFYNKYWWHPQQAHNAYLELYINIGFIGSFLFLFCIIRSLISIEKSLHASHDYEYQTFRLTYITIFFLISWTEAYLLGFAWLTQLFVLFETRKLEA